MNEQLLKIKTSLEQKLMDKTEQIKEECMKRYEKNMEQKIYSMSEIIMKSCIKKNGEGNEYLQLSLLQPDQDKKIANTVFTTPGGINKKELNEKKNIKIPEKLEENEKKNPKNIEQKDIKPNKQIEKENNKQINSNKNNINNNNNNHNHNNILNYNNNNNNNNHNNNHNNKNDNDNQNILEEVDNNNVNINHNQNDINTSQLNLQTNKKESEIQQSTKKIYSFECTNIVSLIIYLYKGTPEVKTTIFLKNNGNAIWPMNNTKLIFDKESSILGEDMTLEPQKPDEEKKYVINFKNVEKYDVGEYKSYLWFYLNGEKIGDKILITFKIKEKENQDNEMDKYMDKIKELRDTYGISKEDCSDERILNVLKESNFDSEEAFNKLFN